MKQLVPDSPGGTGPIRDLNPSHSETWPASLRVPVSLLPVFKDHLTRFFSFVQAAFLQLFLACCP